MQNQQGPIENNYQPEIRSGGRKLITIQTQKGEFKVWTQRIGNNPTMKVLLLHGGPGCNHEYLHPFESYLPDENIEFYYYDQLGSSFSDQPKGQEYLDLWTIDRFVDEVEQVRIALGLNSSNFYLYGHSWGGVLCIEYALKYQKNLKGLIISNMMSNSQEYQKYASQVIGPNFPKEVFEKIQEFEMKNDYENPEYMQLLFQHHYPKHVMRLSPFPPSAERTMKVINQEIYIKIQGPSEFGVKGDLEKWDRSGDLKNITVDTLVLGATHDTMDPKHMEWMSNQFPKGKYYQCPNGSHMSFWDDQNNYFDNLCAFIKEVDKKLQ